MFKNWKWDTKPLFTFLIKIMSGIFIPLPCSMQRWAWSGVWCLSSWRFGRSFVIILQLLLLLIKERRITRCSWPLVHVLQQECHMVGFILPSSLSSPITMCFTVVLSFCLMYIYQLLYSSHQSLIWQVQTRANCEKKQSFWSNSIPPWERPLDGDPDRERQCSRCRKLVSWRWIIIFWDGG
jgi:hypothetical protein